MNLAAPHIDLRTQKELAEQIRSLLLNYCGDYWSDEEQITADAWTNTQVQIYARLMEVIIKHINRIPDKSFLSFLDTLGVGPLPPKPAKTALSFALAKGAPKNVKIPAGTQVAAEKSDDGNPILFETTNDLEAIQATPVKVVSILPSEDKWRNHSPILLNEEKEGTEQLFNCSELIKHRVYFGHKEQFAFDENKRIKLITEVPTDPDKIISNHSVTRSFPPPKGKVHWYTYSLESEEQIELQVAPDTDPEAADLQKSGTIHFESVPPILEKEISGYIDQQGNQLKKTNRWIFAELSVPVTKFESVPLKSVNCLVEDIQANTKYFPDLVFNNKLSLDVTKDFFPFGERPKYNDTLYISSQEVLSKHEAEISIDITFTKTGGHSSSGAINLSWEYWDGASWKSLTVTDGTAHFTKDNGTAVTFKCPEIVGKKINGKDGTWIRVRITGGDYGQDAQYEEKTINYGKDGDQKDIILTVWSLKTPESYEPPLIQKLTLSYDPKEEGKELNEIIAYNDFLYEESITKTKNPPFRAIADNDLPAFYIAFDKAISDLPLNLFFPLATEVFAAPGLDSDATPPRLKWESWNGKKWISPSIEDETGELTRRGIVTLLMPEECFPCTCFGEEHYWIRAKLVNGVYPDEPRLEGLYGNAVWAHNKVSVEHELLGSGNGIPNHQLRFSSYPVLPGQHVYVRESELTEEEKQRIIEEEGLEAFIDVESDSAISETWVRWHEVNHFWFSGPHSRHYQLDRQTGIITFGDGDKGMIPQAGRNNIIATPYTYGGGLRGNVAVRQLTKLRKAIAYVDSVFNPVTAEGGTDVEDLDSIRIRGPRSIRHRNKAVTLTDYEWLVQEASSKIARVKGLSVTNPQKQFKPGWVTLMIVPYSQDAKPLPSAELISEATEYLSQKAPSCLTDQVPLQQINLIPPNYLRVQVNVEVIVKSINDAKEAEFLVEKRLNTLFHPLRGGSDGKGWEFGRDIYKSEIFEALEEIDKVDYVNDLELLAAEQIYQIRLTNPLPQSLPFPDHSKVQFDGNRISMALAEEFGKESDESSIWVLGFMEGDRIELTFENKDNKEENTAPARLKLFITDVGEPEIHKNHSTSCLLYCTTVEAEADFPMLETVVETYLKPNDQMIRSYLMSDISRGDEVTSIRIAVPKADDQMIMIHRDWQSSTLSETVERVRHKIDTVYLEKDYLVYSGTHDVKANLFEEDGEEEEGQVKEIPNDKDPDATKEKDYHYLVNTRSGEVHDLSNVKERCSLQFMKWEHMKYLVSLDEIEQQLADETFDYCSHCFGKHMSKR